MISKYAFCFSRNARHGHNFFKINQTSRLSAWLLDCLTACVLRTMDRPKKQPQVLDFPFRGVLASLLWGPILTREENWQARIPFVFHFDHATLPPGDYSFSIAGRPGGIRLRDRRSGRLFPVLPVRREPGKSEPSLVFLRRGRQHFLRQIWLPGFPGYGLAPTRMERDLETAAGRPVVVSVPVEECL